MREALLSTDLPFPVRRGKVRDVYDLGDRLLLVATDRISAFDWVLPTGIPDKGRVLTTLSSFWFDHLDVPNHRLSVDVRDFKLDLDPGVSESLRGRAMLVRRTDGGEHQTGIVRLGVPVHCAAGEPALPQQRLALEHPAA